MSKWIHENKIATAFMLGCIVTAAYTLFVWLDMEADESDASEGEKPEVKHERRSARRSA